MKCIVHYFEKNGETRWKCPKEFLGLGSTHGLNLETCYRANCPGRKPNAPICKWKKCNNPVGGNKLRHCSERCRKRDNDHAYRMRLKQKKINEQCSTKS